VRSPVLGVERYQGEIRRRVHFLSSAEEEALIRACSEPCEIEMQAKRNLGGRRGGKVSKRKRQFKVTYTPPRYLRPLIVAAIRSGLRRRTLLSVRWRDVDLETGVWDIPGEFLKTATPYRQPMAPSVVEELKSWRAHLLKKEGTARVLPAEPIFGFAPSSSFKKAFQTAVARAGLEELTFHGLRACFLNRLRERGVPIDAAVELTGHRSLDVVLRHYRAVPQDELKAALRTLDTPAPAKAQEPPPEKPVGEEPAG
jgi:integrase